MKRDQGRQKIKGIDGLIAEMGRERVALRAKRVTVSLLLVSSVTCLLIAFASLASLLPYAVVPAAVMMSASAVGFGLAYIEWRSP